MNIKVFKRAVFFAFIGLFVNNYGLLLAEKKPRILHVITYLKIGGVEAQLYDLLKYFVAAGKTEHHVVYFQHGPKDMLKKIRELGVPVYRIKGLSNDPKPDPLLYYRFKKLIKKLKPDLIHSGLLTADIVARWVGKSLEIPVVCEIHGDCLNLPPKKNELDAKTAHLADCIVSTSLAAKKSFEVETLSRVKDVHKRNFIEQNLTVIQNGIYVEKTRTALNQAPPLRREDIGLAQSDFVFGYVGSLIGAKKIELLLEAFEKLCRAVSCEPLQRVPKLCIVGDGVMMNSLKKYARDHAISDKVIFMGYREDRHRFYPLFDAFAMASLSESLSISMLDAMCFGLPLISTSRWETHDLIEHNKNGLLVAMNSSEELVKAMLFLYQNPLCAQQMGIINKKIVEEKFSFEKKATLYEQLFSATIQKGKRAY